MKNQEKKYIKATIVIIFLIAIVAVLNFSQSLLNQDNTESYPYAINKATEILNTLLDDVPFAIIREGNPGFIKVDDLPKDKKFSEYTPFWAKKLCSKLFNSNNQTSKGFPCRGIVTDSVGISYLVHLKVEDILSNLKPNRPEMLKIGAGFPNIEPNQFPERLEVFFTVLKNPSTLSNTNFAQIFSNSQNDKNKPFTELDIASNSIYESSNNFYKDEGLENLNVQPKYSFINPTAERYTAKMLINRLPYKIREDKAFCPFKKLIVQIQWNSNPKYYSEPENQNGNIQRIHLMAIKGNLDI